MPAGSFQTLTLEYRVFDQCDGTTEAPPFSEGVLDDRQIYVFEVQRLGIIPLRFGEEEELPANPSAPANRTLTWSLFTGVPQSQVAGAGVNVGSRERSSGLLQIVEPVGQIADGSEGLYLRRCVPVPQGGVLVVDQIDSPPVGPAIIRLRVQQVENGEQAQMLAAACCCKNGELDINVPDDGSTSDPCPEDLSLSQVNPFGSNLSLSAITVTLTGSGFSELVDLAVGFFDPNTAANLPVTNVNLINDTTIEVDVVPQTLGTFDVVVGDPNAENCFAVLVDAFTVSPRPQ